MSKERLDVLVQRQLGVSRSKAQGLIHTGHVSGEDGALLDKPGARFPRDTVFVVSEDAAYVSRGGEKLEAGLRAFACPVEGRVAIDVGASTGGFTDCLLAHGASRVYAVDVGYGQLAWKLRQDPRVVVLERTNIRYLEADQLQERPSLFTVDCSFISVRLVLEPLKALLADAAQGLVLIKPQFEAGRERVGKGGVVRDAAVHAQVIEDVRDAVEALGFDWRGVVPSPLLGPAGNREFLAHLCVGRA